MKYLLSILVIIFIFWNGFSAPVEFSVKERSVIYTNSLTILNGYQNIINQIGDHVINNLEAAKSSSESFLELFVNRQVFIFNDLDPTHKLSLFYEAETYISNLLLWYPDGIKIELDFENARVGDIIQHEQNVYSLDVLVSKKIDGNYLNQTLNRNTEELTFRIAFTYKNRSFDNYKIVGIRSIKSGVIPDYTKDLSEVNSEDFDESDLLKIHEGLKSVLSDYTNFLTLLGDPQEPDADKEFYKSSFVSLFPDENIKVFNDIQPRPEMNLISVRQYLENYKNDYPAGIRNLSLTSDSARFGKVVKMEDGSLFSYVYAAKFFSGTYKEREIFREMFPLTFKIAFRASGKTFSDFKILSVDIAAKNFFEQDKSIESLKIPELKIQPVTRKGFSLILYGPYGISHIRNMNFENLKMEVNNFKWDSNPSYSFSGGIGFYYFQNDHLALRSGLEMNNFQSVYTLKGSFLDTKLSADINDDSYYKTIQADYDSLVSVNYISLPFLLSYTSAKPGKLSFYFEAGPQVSYAISANSTIKGDYKYLGYYPDHPDVTKYLSLSELGQGFYTDADIDRKRPAEISNINLSVYGSFGFNIPLGYFYSIQIGPEAVIGISDLQQKNKEYIDIFGNKFDHRSTTVKKYGIRIGLVYKL